MISENIRYKMALLVLISLALQLSFTFIYVDPATVLSGDMKLFWERAMTHINGDIHDVHQWMVWPVMPHIILSWIIQAFQTFWFKENLLNAVITLGILLNSMVPILVYRITEEVARKTGYKKPNVGKAAFIAGLLYSISLPHILLSAHILSEMFSIPAFMFALYLIIKPNKTMLSIFTAGLAFSFACLLRPAFGLEGFAMVALIACLHSTGFIDWVKKAGIFTIGFAIVMMIGMAETKFISNGNIKGVGANGALVFYIHQCDITGWLSVDPRLLKPGESYNNCVVYKKFKPPYKPGTFIQTSGIDLHADDACNGAVGGSTMIGIWRHKQGKDLYEIHGVPPWDSDYFWNKAKQCIANEGFIEHWGRILNQTQLLFQYIYPSRAFIEPDNHDKFRPGGKPMLITTTLWNCLFAIMALVLPWALILTRKERKEKFTLAALGLIPLIVLITCALFALDGRYLIPVIFMAYIMIGLIAASKSDISEDQKNETLALAPPLNNTHTPQ